MDGRRIDLAVSNPIPKRRGTRSWAWAAILILAGMGGLIWSLCAPSDISDNPARNGGYMRGAVFVLQQPIVVTSHHYAYAVPEATPRQPGDVIIPAGVRLQIVEVTYRHDIVVDSVRRSQPVGRFLDGPLAGTSVKLQEISTPTAHQLVAVDSAFLTSETMPKATTGTYP